jgi:hypothetical protein
LAAHPKEALNAAQGDAFLEGFEDLGFEGVAVLDFQGFLDKVLAAGAAQQALLEIGLHAVFDGVFTLAMGAVQHGLAYINLRAPLPKMIWQLTTGLIFRQLLKSLPKLDLVVT